jgi:hypothetical protein
MKQRLAISLGALLLAAGLGAALWLSLLGGETASPVAREEAPAVLHEAEPVATFTALASNVEAKDEHGHEHHEHPVAAPSVNHSVYDPARHPHPLTEEHARIQRENHLIQRANDAMDLKNPADLRRVVSEYKASYPEDTYALQAGYLIVADCMEQPGPAARAAAERYMVEKRASTLRRFVRRHCLGGR